MRLKVLLPARVLIDEEVNQITAEAENGSFSLLPRHIDFVAALVPGLLSFIDSDWHEQFLAVDGGMLVKAGQDVLVSTSNAVPGPDLGELRQMVEEQFRQRAEEETAVRSAVARLEADFVRRFMQLGERTHG
jgi:F-type H+-transporting ATPase subunit epsilon